MPNARSLAASQDAAILTNAILPVGMRPIEHWTDRASQQQTLGMFLEEHEFNQLGNSTCDLYGRGIRQMTLGQSKSLYTECYAPPQEITPQ